MKTKLFTFGILSVMLLWSCEKDFVNSNEKNTDNTIVYDEIEQQIVQADNLFGIELFKQLYANKEEENIFVSPLSVALALGMAYNGADGTTKTAMEQTLHKQGLSVKEINDTYKKLIYSLLNADANVTLSIANSIWYRNTFPIEQDFLNINQNYFDAEVTPLDFNNAEVAKNTINNWVDEKTNHKIDKIIDGISSEDVMFLINAIYFKGIWKYEFKKENTDEYPFYLANGVVKNVPMMRQGGEFNYFSNTIFTAIELPYGEEFFKMIILLPHQNKSTDEIIAQLDSAKWNEWMNEFRKTKIAEVRLPKFKFDYEKPLKEVLSDMGMGIAFSDDADFSKINPYAPLQISEVKHKTFVEVNEEGTEAAAVTVVGFTTTSTCASCPPNNPIFIVDKPFLFAIKEQKSNAIIFLGKVGEPVIEEN